ncbi:MAG: hypothetical protein ACK47B_28820 [Armatimonadota bacterium]
MAAEPDPSWAGRLDRLAGRIVDAGFTTPSSAGCVGDLLTLVLALLLALPLRLLAWCLRRLWSGRGS